MTDRQPQPHFDADAKAELTARILSGDLAAAGRLPGTEEAIREILAELTAEVASLKAQVVRLEVSARELERVKRSSSWRVTEPLRHAKARLSGRR